MEFGERLKETLTWKGISQTELAKMLNIRKSAVTNWIKGYNEPTLKMFVKICILLDETPNYFLGFDD